MDARWRLQKKDIDDLNVIQRQILEAALRCLKPGGRIVYSTCSIDPEENLELVTKFAKDHQEVTLGESRQLLPFKDDCDGAFAAILTIPG